MHTIVASATPWGRGALAVVRLSGTELTPILARFCRPRGGFPPPRRVRLCALFDGGGDFDEALLTLFEGPRSYTGEDVAELSCHGNPLVVERLLAAAVAAGATVAQPGEFTRRAFLNGRMDLTRAEAVLQAIDAATSEGLAVARAGLDGAVAGLAQRLVEGLTSAIAELEARLDYPSEDLLFEEDAALAERLEALESEARAAAGTWRAGRILVDGARVALVGPVNAGKSSLFNALGGSQRALVSPTPGTTRDVLERRVVLGSVAVTLLDTAGERESDDPLETAGVALGRQLTEDVDLVLVVLPAQDPAQADAVLQRTAGRPRLVVANHSDHPDAQASPGPDELGRPAPGVAPSAAPWLRTCAPSGEGVAELATAIAEALVGELPGGSALVIASQRQRDLLLSVAQSVAQSRAALAGEAGVAVAAEELYGTLERLDALTGRDSREAVLDELFRRFCIGK